MTQNDVRSTLGTLLILPGSQADSALRRLIEGTDRLIISRAIVDELLDVLSRKFAKDADELARVAVFPTDLADIVGSKRGIARYGHCTRTIIAFLARSEPYYSVKAPCQPNRQAGRRAKSLKVRHLRPAQSV